MDTACYECGHGWFLKMGNCWVCQNCGHTIDDEEEEDEEKKIKKNFNKVAHLVRYKRL